jgi:hypothetical protein
LTSTAAALGVSSSTLQSDLSSGQTLSQIASSKGVSSSTLLTALEQDITSNAPAGASSLSSTQLQSIASAIANNAGPGHTPSFAGVSSVDAYA